MKLSSQIKFIATIFVVLISINQINGSTLRRSHRFRRDSTHNDEVTTAKVDVIEGAVAAADNPDSANGTTTPFDPLASPVSTKDDKDSVDHTTEQPIKPKNKPRDKFKKPDPYEPPEKTWRALQISGIAAFVVIVAYYVNKMRKKFEREHENDSL